MRNLLALLIIIGNAGYSQVGIQQVIVPAANTYHSGDIDVTWTLGEIVNETFNASGLQLSQGLNEISEQIVVTGDIHEKETARITVYPIPFENEFTVQAEGGELIGFLFELIDLNGRHISIQPHQESDGQVARFNASELSIGSYILRVQKKGDPGILIFKLVKQ